jgi:Asp-tRNA(Asn)/Glu-tRNA(Gln) amidotransferase A subunit family amidase
MHGSLASFQSANYSRRTILKSVVSAAPLCMGAAAIPLIQGCSNDTGRQSGSEPWELGARAAVESIRRGEIKAEDYAAQLIKRYHSLEHLNAIITIDEGRVLEEARAVDEARLRGDQLGSLAGLPLIVKDNIDVAGYPTTVGNAMLKGNVPKESSPIIDTAIRQGAIVFAKGNMSMFGGLRPSGATSNNRHFGQPRNPYNSAHISGGSSGGPGTAVGARIVPAGFGEDSGGSVRFPSASCGIAGLRPSTGGAGKRYSDVGFAPPPTSFTKTIGPMARSVADVAFLDTAVTGDAVPTVTLNEIRIGIPDEQYWSSKIYDPAVRQVTEEAFSRLRAAGANLVEIHLDTLLDLNAGDRLRGPRAGREIFGDWLARNVPGVTLEDVFDPMTGGRGVPEVTEAQPVFSSEAHAEMLSMARAQYREFFGENGLFAIAFPTILFTAPLENSNGDTPGQKILVGGKWVNEWDHIIINLFWNARLGVPGLSLPSGLAAGLPVGLELDAMIGEDSRLLGLGMAVENVLGPIAPPQEGVMQDLGNVIR